MNNAILGELQFFMISIVWGSLILVIYDCLRIIRKVIKHKQFVIGIEDILYWILCGHLIFQMMYKHNSGIIRAFAILGIFIGMIIYRYILSDFLVDNISGFLNKIIKSIYKIIKLLKKQIKSSKIALYDVEDGDLLDEEEKCKDKKKQ